MSEAISHQSKALNGSCFFLAADLYPGKAYICSDILDINNVNIAGVEIVIVWDYLNVISKLANCEHFKTLNLPLLTGLHQCIMLTSGVYPPHGIGMMLECSPTELLS